MSDPSHDRFHDSMHEEDEEYQEDDEMPDYYQDFSSLQEKISQAETFIKVDPMKGVNQVHEWIHCATQGKFGNDECTALFWRELPRLMNSFLRKAEFNGKYPKLLTSVHVLVKQLQQDTITSKESRHILVSVAETLAHILVPSRYTDCKQPVYPHYDIDADSDDDDEYMDDTPTSRPHGDTSSVWNEVVLFFTRNTGAPDSYLKIMGMQGDHKPSATVIMWLLRPFTKIHQYVPSSSYHNWAKKIGKIVPDYLKGLSDKEVKNEDKHNLNKIIEFLSTILQNSDQLQTHDNMPNQYGAHYAEIETHIEELQLELAMKCLCNTESLEKRLAGLHDIVDFITRVKRKEEYDTMRYGHPHMQYSGNTPSFDCPWFAQWLVDHKVIDILYGETAHNELFKRCTDVVKFIAKEGYLRDHHVEMIWNSVKDKHEAVSTEILNGIVKFLQYLDPAHQGIIFDNMREVPHSEYTPAMLGLIKQAAALQLQQSSYHQQPAGNGEGNSPPPPTPVLDMLWEAIQEGSTVPQEIQRDASSILTELLRNGYTDRLRQIYLEKCVFNLKAIKSVTITLQVMEQILQGYNMQYGYHYDGALDKKQHCIEWLDKEHQLLHAFVTEFEACTDRAIKSIAGFAAEGVEITSDYPLLNVIQQELQTRVQFGTSILTSSNLSLNNQDMSTLWKCLVHPDDANNIPPALLSLLRETAFKWMKNMPLNGSVEASWLSSSSLPWVFENLICPYADTHTASLTESGYQLIMHFFKTINTMNQRMISRTIGNKDHVEFESASEEIQDGMDTLWKIALEAENPTVGKMAIDHLTQLWQNSTPSLESQQAHRRREFINKCMAILCPDGDTSGQQTTTTDVIALRWERCVLLLRNYIRTFEKHLPEEARRKLQHHGTMLRGNMLDITVSLVAPGPKVTVQIADNAMLYQLKCKLAAQLQYPVHQLRLVMEGKELKDDSATIADLNIAHKPIFAARNGSASAIQQWENIPKWSYPSELLQAHWDKLFDLLVDEKCHGGLEELIWQLLQALPPNTDVMTNVRSLALGHCADTDWSNIFDINNVFKLLYALQIVDILTNVDESFSQNFRKAGGVGHLVRTFMSMDAFAEVGKTLPQKDTHPPKKAKPNHGKPGSVETWLRVLDGIFKLLTLVTEGCDIVVLLEDGNVKRDDIVQQFFSVLSACSTMDAHSDLVKSVVKHTMNVLKLSTDASLEWTNAIANRATETNWLECCLLQCPVSSTRQAIVDGLTNCLTGGGPKQPHNENAQATLQLFVRKMLSFLSNVSQYCGNTVEYFKFLVTLLEELFASCVHVTIDIGIKPDQLVLRVITMIMDHPITERRYCPDEDDVLRGLGKLLCTLVRMESQLKLLAGQYQRDVQGKSSKKGATSSTEGGQSQFLLSLLNDCLFDIPTESNHGQLAPPKCKNKGSRKTIFELLQELCTDCRQNLTFVMHHLLAFHPVPTSSCERTMWNYAPIGQEKSSAGYVGLKNLGATCYMNSLLQQLYTIRPFRYTLLTSEPVYDGSKNDVADVEQEGSMLKALQNMFSHLQESEKKFYDTRPFCTVYKDYDGASMNTGLQMDVQEFLNMFFDKMETSCKYAPTKEMLKMFFGGSVEHSVCGKSNNCNCTSTREEPTFCLELEVKNKRNLKESLELFVKGEMLTGDNKYKCDNCGMVDAVKRDTIKTLPNYLIVHLKRFEFDLDSMRKIKLNDLFEFPFDLDLSPYCTEGVQQREEIEQFGKATTKLPHPAHYYQYKLTGVLVHAGTADSGHYYSFIKEKDTDDDRWYQFNDTVIDNFSSSELANHCFGGAETVTQMDPLHKRSYPISVAKQYNAYMLFYERKKMIAPDTKGFLIPVPKDSPCMTTIGKLPCIKTVNSQATLVEIETYKRIWEDNMTFLRDKNLFDTNYFSFVDSLVRHAEATTAPDSDEYLLAIQLGTQFVIETLSHAKERDTLKPWIALLSGMYSKSKHGCHWFVDTLADEDCRALRSLLLNCTASEARSGFGELLIHVMHTVFVEEQLQNADGYSDTEIDDEEGTDWYDGPTGNVYRTMGSVLALLRDIPSHWRTFHDYFKVIMKFTCFGIRQRQFVIESNLVVTFIEMYQEDCDRKRPRMVAGDRQTFPNFSAIMQAIANLIRSCHRPSIDPMQRPLPPPNANVTSTVLDEVNRRNQTSLEPSKELLDLHSDAWDLLFTKNDGFFLQRAIIDNLNLDACSDICTFVVYEHERMSLIIIDMCKESIIKNDETSIKGFFSVLVQVLLVEDSLMRHRVEQALPTMLQALRSCAHYPNHIGNALLLIKHLVEKNECAREWMLNNPSGWLPLIMKTSEQVREHIYHLARSLVPDALSTYLTVIPISSDGQELMEPLPPTTNKFPPLAELANTQLLQLHQYLLSLLEAAEEFRHSHDHRQKYAPTLDHYTDFKLVQYFKLLRYCVRSDQAKEQFHQCKFNVLLNKMDEMHLEQDQNKKEACLYWYVCAVDYPANIDLYTAEDKVNKMMDYFVSLSDQQIAYNQAALPSFYSLMAAGCEHSPEFMDKVLDHRNFEWATTHLFFDSDEFRLTAEQLSKMVAMGIEHKPAKRLHWISKIIAAFNKQQHSRPNDSTTLDVLLKLMSYQETMTRFLDKGGLTITTTHYCNKQNLVQVISHNDKVIPLLGKTFQAVLSFLSNLLYSEPNSRGERESTQDTENAQMGEQYLQQWTNAHSLVNLFFGKLLPNAKEVQTRSELMGVITELGKHLDTCCLSAIRCIQHDAKVPPQDRCHPTKLLMASYCSKTDFLNVLLPQWEQFVRKICESALKYHHDNGNVIHDLSTLLWQGIFDSGSSVKSQTGQIWCTEEFNSYMSILEECAKVHNQQRTQQQDRKGQAGKEGGKEKVTESQQEAKEEQDKPEDAATKQETTQAATSDVIDPEPADDDDDADRDIPSVIGEIKLLDRLHGHPQFDELWELLISMPLCLIKHPHFTQWAIEKQITGAAPAELHRVITSIIQVLEECCCKVKTMQAQGVDSQQTEPDSTPVNSQNTTEDDPTSTQPASTSTQQKQQPQQQPGEPTTPARVSMDNEVANIVQLLQFMNQITMHRQNLDSESVNMVETHIRQHHPGITNDVIDVANVVPQQSDVLLEILTSIPFLKQFQ